MELADHGAKAEELIKHFRGETDRREPRRAPGRACARRTERENAEAKETLLASGWSARGAEAAAATQRRRGGARAVRRWGEELEAWAEVDNRAGRHLLHARRVAFQPAADPASYADDDDETRERKEEESDVVSVRARWLMKCPSCPSSLARRRCCRGTSPGDRVRARRDAGFVGRMLGALNQVAVEHVAPAAAGERRLFRAKRGGGASLFDAASAASGDGLLSRKKTPPNERSATTTLATYYT